LNKIDLGSTENYFGLLRTLHRLKTLEEVLGIEGITVKRELIPE